MRCLAAREPGPARAHPDTAHTLRFAATECMGTPEVERQGKAFRPALEQRPYASRWMEKAKGPGSLGNPAPWNQGLEAARLRACLSRMHPTLLPAALQGS